MKYIITIAIIVPLLALTGSPAIAREVNEKDQQTARSAWVRAVSLANARNAGKTCEADAYQPTILSELGVAVMLSPYLQNELANGTSASAKALRQALSGNLMLYDLIGRMSTPKQTAEAIVGSVWYSRNGRATGSLSIMKIEKNRVQELVLDPDLIKSQPVVWTYSFDARTGQLTLKNGATTRRYTLEKDISKMWYELTTLDLDGVDYVNEPDDCSL